MRNGRIALFFIGYLLLVLLMAFLALGGIGAGVVAVRAGKAEAVAQAVLTALFLSAFVTSLALGFGLNSVFSDVQLRRYPLRRAERHVARYLTGMLDPFWFLFLALEFGLAIGLYVFGAVSLPLGILAVVLLYLCNYLAAQTAASLFERVGQMRGGAMILSLGLFGFAVVPGAAAPWLIRHPAAGRVALKILGVTPGFGAGSLMTRADLGGFYGFALLLLWIAAFAAALTALEHWQPKTRAAAKGSVRWDSPAARIGALCGPAYGPLVTYWLQFYFRCKRFRIAYALNSALIPMLIFWSRQSFRRMDPSLARSAGIFALIGFASAAPFICNQFGYVGGGFRRFFLVPADPGRALRASSYVLASLCAAMLVPATAFWVAFAPAGAGGRSVLMMLFYGLTGLFAFHGAGLWTTLYGPRRSDPNATMGNDLSLAGNVLLMGSMIPLLVGPQLLSRSQRWRNLFLPDHWELAALAACAAAVFYFLSLRSAARLVSSRREQLLAVVDGKV